MTSLGTLCLGHHEAEVGDIACVFGGVPVPFLLRPDKIREGLCTFVSDAWVFGLMNGEAFEQELHEQIFIIE